MTEVDEHLLTAAKLAEKKKNNLGEPDDRMLDHLGLIAHDTDRSVLSFVENSGLLEEIDEDAATFSDTELGSVVESTLVTDELTDAVVDGRAFQLSHAVGWTENDLDASALTLSMRINDQLDNNAAPAFLTGIGNPNTGKTNLVAMCAELRGYDLDDLLVISNARSWSETDLVATSMHDLVVALLEHRDVPKFIFVDEGSTHFDARTYSREVSRQWTPAAKRFAKMGVDTAATVGHTGKDLHPEVKRLTTLAFDKTEKKAASFFESWDSEEEYPEDRLFGGDLEAIEPARNEPDPDDSAPWSWNLEPELFALDLGWADLLDELRARGPADDK